MSAPTSSLRSIWRLQIDLLRFRVDGAELREAGGRHLLFGLFCTWVVGMGRWWDSPTAGALQKSGLGSIAYALFMASFLWLLFRPLGPRPVSYRQVLTFITQVALPGIIYAVPVEMFLSVKVAQTTNYCLLGVVATWRVALLFYFLRHVLLFSPPETAVAGLLPLAIIMTVVSAGLSLGNTLNNMGGIQEAGKGGRPAAEVIAEGLAQLGLITLIPLLGTYFYLWFIGGSSRSAEG